MICNKLRECCENDGFVCENKERCIVYKDFRKNAVCEEKKKRYNIVNDKNCMIALYHVDGGMIYGEANVQKCDFMYLIYDSDNPTVVFVELKGSDIYHAVQQLKETIDRYGAELQRRICARIVCSSVPRLHNDPIVKNLRKELMKRYNGSLTIFEKNKDEKYSDI